jgi:hypothetical protein
VVGSAAKDVDKKGWSGWKEVVERKEKREKSRGQGQSRLIAEVAREKADTDDDKRGKIVTPRSLPSSPRTTSYQEALRQLCSRPWK